MVEKSEKYGYWFEDSFTAFFARLKSKPGIYKETLLNMSKWPNQVKKSMIQIRPGHFFLWAPQFFPSGIQMNYFNI
jgi:hypothetical protein